MSRNEYEPPMALRIDRVLSSQPELGPSAPDGGYGWIVLVATLLLQLFFPSVIVAYGIFLLIYRIENVSGLPDLYLWDNRLIPAPLALSVVLNLTDPFTKRLIKASTWPRLIATSGICLACAGLLVTWLSIKYHSNIYGLLSAGTLLGIGISLTLNQSDVIVKMYFHNKYNVVTSVIQIAKTIGFVLTPILIGKMLLKVGIMQVLLSYQAILLQGLLVVLVYKKPKYLKRKRRSYKLIEEISDDEDDIFAARMSTELQQTVSSLNNPSETGFNDNIENKSAKTKTYSDVPVKNIEEQEDNKSSVTFKNEVPSAFSATPSSSSFEDNFVINQQQKQIGLQSVSSSVQHKTLHESFADDYRTDLDKIERYSDIPAPLFTEISVNNDNTTYSYDNNFMDGGYTTSRRSSQTVFATTPVERNRYFSLSNIWETINYPSFYKSLLSNITGQLSTFTFWCLFPSFLYEKYDELHASDTTIYMGIVSAGGLLFSVSSSCIHIKRSTRAWLLAIFSFIGSAGYAAIVNIQGDVWLVFGGLHVVLSITAIQTLTTQEKNNCPKNRVEKSREIMLSILTGLFLLFLFTIDIKYETCFRLMSLLHFLNGALWFSNFVFKKIKKHIISQPYPVSTIPSDYANRE